MIFIKNFKFKKKIFFSFYFITFNFLMLLLLHKPLKGSRNIQGFALIRAVLFLLASLFKAWHIFSHIKESFFFRFKQL